MTRIEPRCVAGERVTPEEARRAAREREPLDARASMADLVRRRLHADGVVTYIIDRNVNYTNVCNAFCTFCAFYRPPGHDEGYVLPIEAIERRSPRPTSWAATRSSCRAGTTRSSRSTTTRTCSAASSSASPTSGCTRLSAPEVIHIHKVSRITVRGDAARLRAAGLDSLPGGGAEILVDDVQEAPHEEQGVGVRVARRPRRGPPHRDALHRDDDVRPHRIARRPDRALCAMLRELQDRTGGFTAFIGWTFQPGNTELGGTEATTAEYLRTMAVAADLPRQRPATSRRRG